MSKHHKTATRTAAHRQAIRQVFDEFPVDLLDSPNPTDDAVRAYAPPPSAVEEAPGDDAQARRRRGWFGLARRQQRETAATTKAAAPSAVHHQAFEIERRAQRLEEALAAARDDLGAVTTELDDLHQRLAAADAAVATERAAAAEWHDTASQLNELVDALRGTHEQLQHEHVALGTAFDTEEQGRRHWERVASEQLTALDELGAQLNQTTAELHAEREAHQQAVAYATDVQGQLSALQAQWEEQLQQLTDALGREREEFHRTLEDERHTAEQARAEQAFQHREEVERFQAEASAAIAALQQKVADGQAAIEVVNADLGAARADVVRLNEDLEAARGEALAATTRARENDELRLRAEERIEELGDELSYVRSEVMGSAGGRKKAKGLFGRGKPAPVKAAEKQSRAAMAPAELAAPAVDPDVEDIIERRLFGNV
jgi:chromosome segregation ATPase